MSFGFFLDAGLTVPVTSIRYYSTQIGDKRVYLGDPTPDRQLMDASDPGVAEMEVVVTDSATGSGLAASSVKLSLTSVGLNTAVGGAPLGIGHTLNSGSANAISIYIRFDTSAGVVGQDYTDLGIEIANTIETDV